jgi:hypothetical protein
LRRWGFRATGFVGGGLYGCGMDSGGFDCGAFGQGFDLVGAGLTAVAGESPDALSDNELCASVERCHRTLQAMQAQYLRLVAGLDRRPDAVPGVKTGGGAATFLVHRLNISPRQAALDVKAAHALNPAPTEHSVKRLPQLGTALGAGEVSREHVDVGVRVLKQIPTHLLKDVDSNGECGMDKVDAWLTQTSRTLPPCKTDQAAKHLLDVVDPDHADRFDPAALERRELFTAVDSTGMVIMKGQLDPLNGAKVRRALQAFSRPDPTRHEAVEGEDGQELLAIRDTRTAAQRRADALGTICDLALDRVGAEPDDEDSDAGESRRKDGAAPRLVVHTTPELLDEALHTHPGGPTPGTAFRKPLLGTSESDHLGPVGPGLLGVMACDALIERVLLAPNGAVLDLGRTVRTITPPQRRALTARDRGCVIPGCTALAEWCHGHHVVWWEHSGPTTKNNLALACTRHHAQIHAGIWELRMIDGIPWARPPSWIDPQRRWTRNTYHHAQTQAAQLGTQLRLPGLSQPDAGRKVEPRDNGP